MSFTASQPLCPFGTTSAAGRRRSPFRQNLTRQSVSLVCQAEADFRKVFAIGSKENRRRAESRHSCENWVQRQGISLSHAAPASLLLSSTFQCLGLVGPALAAIHAEPANALSVPTWVIHISSVLEWSTAMLLMWKYAEVTGNEKWKGMTWGMMPLFAGSLCACTYHFFYNSPQMDFLVSLQAALTWIGNATLWAAAYRIYKASQAPAES